MRTNQEDQTNCPPEYIVVHFFGGNASESANVTGGDGKLKDLVLCLRTQVLFLHSMLTLK